MVFDRRNGIYRGIVIAAFGLALVGTGEPPKHTAKPEQPKAVNPKPQRAPAVAASATKPIETIKPFKQQEPCGPRRYGSNDDLCAQWKAADSASDPAMWAWIQTFLSAVGIVGLLVSLWLTRRTLNVANETHQAFVKSEDALLVFNFPDGIRTAEGSFLLDMMVTNTGRSAATIHKVEIYGEPVIMETVFISGQQTRMPSFADVPSDGNLTLKVVFSSPFGRNQVLKLAYRVLAPKGNRQTWWAINVNWDAQKA